MITKEELDKAVQQKELSEKVIKQYYDERTAAFDERMENNPVFTDEELVYAATSLCPCGHGAAYPKDCGPNHYWDCSAILKGIADKTVEHMARMPFMFYDLKSEGQPSAGGATTRGVFRPKKKD